MAELLTLDSEVDPGPEATPRPTLCTSTGAPMARFATAARSSV